MRTFDKRYQELCTRFQSRFPHDEHDDLDAIHQAYLEIGGGEHFESRAFLRRKDQSRRSAWKRANEKPLVQEINDSAKGPCDTLMENEQTEVVQEAVMRLPEIYRKVVALRFFDELSPAEIATTLSVPRKTVYTRLRQAKELLKALLVNYVVDGQVEGVLAA